MVLWPFVLLLWIGLGTSYPTTKLEPVPSNTTMADQTMVEVGATHTGKVELTLPFKITTKEELVTWVTYAMRIMASRINITLASADPEVMPPERIEKLKNSSVVINNFLEKMNNDERTRLSGDERNMPDKRLNSMQDDRRMSLDEKRYQQDERRRQPDEMRRPQEPGKTVKTASMGGVKHDSRMDDMRRTTPPTTNCKKLERQLYRLTSTTENPNARNDMGVNVDIHASRPMSHQEQTRPLTFTNPFTKYIQELALINPYDHPDNKVFRDPDIFPPFNVQQHQNGYIPLPVRPAYHEENLKQYYAMANGQNVSQPSMFGVRTDPLGSLQLVPSRNNYHSPPITSQTTRTELADLNSGTIGIAFQQPHTIPFSTPLRPVLSVPFEAVITITRDSESSTPTSIMRPEKVSAVMLPPKRNSSSSQRGTKTPTSSSQKKKKNKNRDSSHSASATNVQDSLAPSSQKSKKKNSGKTTVQFDGDKSQRVSKSKKKKEKPPSTMFSALKFLVRMLTLVNGNATSPAVSNVFSKISKKGPNSKLLQVK
ncbi:hypothetical protein TSAR_014807 [Trichomalopsis sarcophagae]|uniref:Uncharacterized protein n=1 Tax=Trichomalopsis sarcophagae TaxID=543379 RepID=A0A232FHE2_9HYME|nr:hypothetical protein TSAR_014807 [Trichomalopsis sarcophagae]